LRERGLLHDDREGWWRNDIRETGGGCRDRIEVERTRRKNGSRELANLLAAHQVRGHGIEDSALKVGVDWHDCKPSERGADCAQPSRTRTTSTIVEP
jgi:hypothetical protein